jgi:DNA integrity scanning protein DisA with diadenylate cyclase activity
MFSIPGMALLHTLYTRFISLILISPYILVTIVIISGAFYDPQRNIPRLTITWVGAMAVVWVAMKLLGKVMEWAPFMVVVAAVVWQPELRKVAGMLGAVGESEESASASGMGIPNANGSAYPVPDPRTIFTIISESLQTLAANNTPALLISTIPGTSQADTIIAQEQERVVPLEANITTGLLLAIFSPTSSLRGGIVLRNGRIACALKPLEGEEEDPLEVSKKYPGTNIIALRDGQVKQYKDGVEVKQQQDDADADDDTAQDSNSEQEQDSKQEQGQNGSEQETVNDKEE